MLAIEDHVMWENSLVQHSQTLVSHATPPEFQSVGIQIVQIAHVQSLSMHTIS